MIDATATQNLSRFKLDFRHLYTISNLTVNGESAHFARGGKQELTISPADPLDSGSDFTVQVEYSGNAKAIKDPDKSIEGWVPTNDGAFVVNEPQGAPAGSQPTTTRRTRRRGGEAPGARPQVSGSGLRFLFLSGDYPC